MITAFLTFAGWVVVSVQKHWRILLPVGLGLLLISFILFFAYCGKSKPVLDERKIQEAIVAIEQKNDARLKEILVEIEVQEKAIDANVSNGRKELVQAAHDARAKYSNMNTAQLAEELEKRK